ncbi:MAG: AMP-binding protein, partial [Candidatus Scalindua sp.]|nr:AMP-binding protein [Candidatus Scalindua sp.]
CVLDEQKNTVPIGVPGELHIGGEGLSRGYLNRPELTKEKFIENPFIFENERKEKESRGEETRIYKTGDLVRWLPDGNLEFIGRVDDQVKIRGFRIEPGEIDARLLEHDKIKQSVVIASEEGAGEGVVKQKRLIAYYILEQGAEGVTIEDLRSHLKESLPDYMLPALFIKLDELPLTPNGKIDRKALPSPNQSHLETGEEYVAPRKEEEKILAEIWQDVLNLERVGIHDNFFALGGDSLMATRVVSRIQRIFNITCPVRDLFEHQNIFHLASLVHERLTGEKVIQQAIAVINRDQLLPLSFAQQRLWFLNRYEESRDITYNMPLALRLKGPINIKALEKSFNALISRHESLRTVFKERDGQPEQEILEAYEVKLSVENIGKEADKEVNKFLSEEARFIFNLSDGPLFRVRLINLGDTEYVLMINQHHIISDGWSIMILMRELSELYNAYSTDGRPNLPEIRFQYADFAYWQKEWLQGEILEEQLSYWKKKLQGFENLELLTDKVRPKVKRYEGRHYQFRLEKRLTDSLKKICNETSTTLFMVLLAAFKVLLSCYSGQKDIVIGTPIANRNHRDTEGVVGFFVNTLVLRDDLSGNPSFIEFLERVKKTCLDAYAHQDIPFEKLVDALQVERDASRTPVFQTMFTLQNVTEVTDIFFKGIEAKAELFDAGISKFDLTLSLIEFESGLSCDIEYDTSLYELETIRRLSGHYIEILSDIIRTPNREIQELRILTKEENQLLIEWNATEAEYPRDKTLYELFEEQVKKTPDNVAVVFEDKQLTYKELNKRANQLARHIKDKYSQRYQEELKADALIGVYIERSLEMIIGILGILKAGGAYVPIDPGYPEERLRFMLEDTGSRIILTQGKLLENSTFLLEGERELICLDNDWVKIAKLPEENLGKLNRSTDLAYVIYTSGSTGKPKGVMIEHDGVCNLAKYVARRFVIEAKTRVLQFASICFDASIYEWVGALLNGGELYLLSSGQIQSYGEITEFLHDKNIEVVMLPPGVLETMKKMKLPSLKTIVSGGDVCTLNIVNTWLEGRKFINAYGPTEGAVCSTMSNCQYNKEPLIGKPIANKTIYVLDNHLNFVPIGVPGELHIG